jgi:hypothetical protein
MVGMARFERATPASRTQCPTKLGHIPTPAFNTQFGGECPSFFSGAQRNRSPPLRRGRRPFVRDGEVELFFVHRHDKRDTKSMSGRKPLIIYDLKCRDGHKFEGWFKDRGAFEKQREKALIACPVCGNTDAALVPSSVAIRGKDGRSTADKQQTGLSPMKVFREFQEYIHKNFDDVGEKFAEVALRIHHGEEDGRNIRGTATQSEEQNLRDEGVRFIKLALPEFDA